MKNDIVFVVLGIILLIGPGLQADVVYRDNFDGDGNAVNTAGLGGGIVNRTIKGHAWVDTGNLQFKKAGTSFKQRALAYSHSAFQSNRGFELTVKYFAGPVQKTGVATFSFGIIRGDLDLKAFSGYNPFGVAGKIHSFGVNLLKNGGRGLNYTQGTKKLHLDAAEFVSGAVTPVVIRVERDGSGGAHWSYSINGVSQGSGKMASFDFSKKYHFAVYGQDNENTFRIISVQLDNLTIPEPSGLF